MTILKETQAILKARYTGKPINLDGLDLDVLFSEGNRITSLSAKFEKENREALERGMNLRDIEQRNALTMGGFRPEPFGTLAEDLYQEGDLLWI